MLLSHSDIRRLIDAGDIIVEPSPAADDIRPVGLRVYLSEDLLIPESGQVVDLASDAAPRFRAEKISADGFRLRPGTFVLAAMREKIKVPCDLVCRLDGRSTWARLGLTVHVTSTTIDGNTCSIRPVTLEIANLGPFEVILRPNVAMGMVTFEKLSSPIEHEITGRYDDAAVSGPKL